MINCLAHKFAYAVDEFVHPSFHFSLPFHFILLPLCLPMANPAQTLSDGLSLAGVLWHHRLTSFMNNYLVRQPVLSV